MASLKYFTDIENRSERAKQVMLLAPALDNYNSRFHLLREIDTGKSKPISRSESDNAFVMHFVWVLRDMFTFERNKASRTKDWESFRQRWVYVLSLPEWARDPRWWRHPSGSYQGDKDFVVHPCHRNIGWTSRAINERIRNLGLGEARRDQIEVLTHTRQVMNTECDCLIQTPIRLIIVECKDKTNFSTEQRQRQFDLSLCLERILDRNIRTIHVELSTKVSDTEVANKWTWEKVNCASQGKGSL